VRSQADDAFLVNPFEWLFETIWNEYMGNCSFASQVKPYAVLPGESRATRCVLVVPVVSLAAASNSFNAARTQSTGTRARAGRNLLPHCCARAR
jgi:hypothetical protein